MKTIVTILAILLPAADTVAASGGIEDAGARGATVHIDLQVSRNEGVAPLAITFDAVGTSADGIAEPFHELEFRWDFGDPTATGVWAESGEPRGRARGAVAAHVFNAPGTYTVWLTVRAPDGNQASISTDIVVSDADVVFAGRTYFVAANGDDGNDGTTPGTPFRTAARASQVANNARILFRRGDTFPITNSLATVGAGPGIFAAYGNGAAPRLQSMPGSARELVLLRHNDWRLLDLEIVGRSPLSSGPNQVGVEIGHSQRRVLVQGMKVSNVNVGLGSAYGSLNRELYWLDNHVHDIGTYGAFLSGIGNAFLGNRLERCEHAHILRIVYAQRWVIAHNTLLEPSYLSGRGRAALKLHSDSGISSDPAEWIVLAANRFRGSTVSVALAPQDAGSNEAVRNVVVERNRFFPDHLSQVLLQLVGHRITVRNNVFLIDRAIDYVRMIDAPNWTVVTQTLGHYRIYHNAGVWLHAPGGSYNEYALLSMANGVVDVAVHNNALWRAHQGGGPDTLIQLGGATALAQIQESHNLRHNRSGSFARVGNTTYTLAQWQSLGQGAGSIEGEPLWRDVAAGDLYPLPASPLIDAGRSLPVFDDINLVSRPLDGLGNGARVPDIGPYERAATDLIFADGFEEP